MATYLGRFAKGSPSDMLEPSKLLQGSLEVFSMIICLSGGVTGVEVGCWVEAIWVAHRSVSIGRCARRPAAGCGLSYAVNLERV